MNKEIVKSYPTEQLRYAYQVLRERTDTAGRRAYEATRVELARRAGENEAVRYLTEDSDQEVIAHALRILESRFRRRSIKADSFETVGDFLRLRFGDAEAEEFHALWLDASNHLIEAERLFVGTINETAIYPREVAKRALQLNAAAVIVAHNHPSGNLKPSEGDERLQWQLMRCFSALDIPLLDHFIVSPTGSFSFADQGMLLGRAPGR